MCFTEPRQAILTTALLVLSLATTIISIVILTRHDSSYLGTRSHATSVCENNMDEDPAPPTTGPAQYDCITRPSEQSPSPLPPSADTVQESIQAVQHDTSASDSDTMSASSPVTPRPKVKVKSKVRRGRTVKNPKSRTPYGADMSARGPYLAKNCDNCTGCESTSVPTRPTGMNCDHYTKAINITQTRSIV